MIPISNPPDRANLDRNAVRRLIDAACEAFEAAWQAKQPRPMEDFFLAVANEHRAELFAELLRVELSYRGTAGVPRRAEDYVEQFPQWREQISEIYAERQEWSGKTEGGIVEDTQLTAVSNVHEPATTSRYTQLKFHAEGGLGRVLVATDVELQRDVALKQLKTRGEQTDVAVQRFLREARITARLEHPGIVPVYGLGVDSCGRPFYTMRLIQGTTFRDRIRALHDRPRRWADGEWRIEVRRMLTHLIAVCRTVDYAHSQGVLHRDLKPANILIGDFGETLVVDWGLAAFLNHDDAEETASVKVELPSLPVADLTATGAILGTPAYMSPESTFGVSLPCDRASDIYGLGATLATLLSGSPPVDGHTALEMFQRTRRGELRFPREQFRQVPVALDAICRRALHLDPELRYRTAAELAEDLERWLAGESVSAHRESPLTSLARWFRRHRTVSTALIVALLVAASLGLASWHAVDIASRRRHAQGLVDALANSEVTGVDGLLNQLTQSQSSVGSLVTERYARALESGDAIAQRNLRLALLPTDRLLLSAAISDVLRADPEEFPHLLNLLRPDSAAVLQDCHSRWVATESSHPLSTAATLASLAPHHPSWPEWAERAVQLLCDEPVVRYSAWKPIFRPVAQHLKPALTSRFQAHDQHPQSAAAAEWISLLFSEDGPYLVELLQTADDRQLSPIVRALQQSPVGAIPKLVEALQEQRPVSLSVGNLEPVRQPQIARSRRRARAAAALLALGRAELVLPELNGLANPTFEATLISIAAKAGVSPDDVARWWGGEEVTTRRRFWTLMLGQFSPVQFSPSSYSTMLAALQSAERNEPDAALHSAYLWLLRRWQIDSPAAAPRRWSLNRRWYETNSGEKYILVTGPVEFLMGSPQDEYLSDVTTPFHVRRVPRSFAIAAFEVTQEQFHNRLPDYPGPKRPQLDDPGSPALCVSLYDCARYCRRLSEEEGIPEDQMCFPPLDQIGPEMTLPADYLTRTGYRLPTEAEWEYCAKAGTFTAASFGDDSDLTSEYAWNALNCQGRARPVGQLMPNPLGLFDVHGNAAEWCAASASLRSYRELSDWGRTVSDNQSPKRFAQQRTYIIRGGQYDRFPATLRSTVRGEMMASSELNLIGLRPVRTLSEQEESFSAVRVLDTLPHQLRYRITGAGEPFRIDVLSDGVTVSPTEGIAPAEVTLVSQRSDSHRYQLAVRNLRSGFQKQVAGTILNVEWQGQVELYPIDESPVPGRFTKGRWEKFIAGHSDPREWAEAIAHRGELNLIRGSGSQGVKAGTEERSFLFVAEAHTQLPPDEYFLQWFVNDYGRLIVDESTVFELSPQNWSRAPGPPYGQIFETRRYSPWMGSQRWHAVSIDGDRAGQLWINLRPVPGLN